MDFIYLEFQGKFPFVDYQGDILSGAIIDRSPVCLFSFFLRDTRGGNPNPFAIKLASNSPTIPPDAKLPQVKAAIIDNVAESLSLEVLSKT